ncbi:MAG: purple acid phosphatase family protein, partial [Saccharofermentanales bacterium]
MPMKDGMTVMWETDIAGSSMLLVWKSFSPGCGEARYIISGDVMTFKGAPGTIHKVVVSGLLSGTDYIYQAVSESGGKTIISRTAVFRTIPGDAASISFVVTSETGGAGRPSCHKQLVDSISGERPDFLVFAGDMVSKGTVYEDWDEYLFTPFRDLIRNTPFYHCAGNHEENSDYMRQFIATSKDGYYSFDYGPAHFVSLDSTQMADHILLEDGSMKIVLKDGFGKGSPQFDFLVSDLEKSEAEWKIVYFHYPPYVSATYQADCLRILCPVL